MLFSASALVVLVLVGGLVASRGGDADRSPTTRTPGAAARAAVTSAYEGYWSAYVTALNPPRRDAKALGAVLVAPELDRVRSLVDARARSRQGVRGRYAHQASVVDLASGKEATVEDCLTLKTVVYDTRTGKTVRKDRPGPFAVTARMVKDGGVWKVAEIGAGKFTCPRPKQPAQGEPR